MTTPANLTYSQIETRVMNSLRLATTNTVEQAKVQNLINGVYRDIAAKKDWWWLLKRAVINTFAMIETGTVNLTQGITGIQFTDAPNIDITGFVIIVPGQANDSNAVYRIESHIAGNPNATLDAAYTDTSNTAATYRVFQDSYSLPDDFGKLLNAKRFGEFLPLRRTGLEEFAQIKLTDQTQGKPEMVGVFDTALTGDPSSPRRLQIHPYPDKQYRIELYYKQNLNTELTGSVRPLIPDDFANILWYGALSRGYPIFLNDVQRGDTFTKLFNDMMALMSAQQKEYEGGNSGIHPDNVYRKRNRRMRGPYTLGSWFDRLPNVP